MKKETTITTMLGVTHHELAMLLNVSRPLITLYESGQRDLPAHATQLLAEMLAHMQSPATAAKRAMHSEKVDSHIETYLLHLHKENEFKRLLIDRKIAAARKKLHALEQRAHLVDFLQARSIKPTEKGTLESLPILIGKPGKKDKYIALAGLQLKKEMLEREKSVLESKLQKFK